MHELSLAVSAVHLIEEAASRERFDRVRVIRLEVGALACVEPEALLLAFESAGKGTCAAGARLELVTVGAAGECPECQVVVPMQEELQLCPRCERRPLLVVDGTQLRVKDLVVE